MQHATASLSCSFLVLSVLHLNYMVLNWNQEENVLREEPAAAVCCQSTPLYPLNIHSKEEAVVWHYKLFCIFSCFRWSICFTLFFNDIIYRWWQDSSVQCTRWSLFANQPQQVILLSAKTMWNSLNSHLQGRKYQMSSFLSKTGARFPSSVLPACVGSQD